MKAAGALSPLNIRQCAHSLLWMKAFDISYLANYLENCPLLLCYEHGCKKLSTIICNKKQRISTYHCCNINTLVINTGHWLSLMSLHPLLWISLPTVEISIFRDLNGSSAIWICVKSRILQNVPLNVDLGKHFPLPNPNMANPKSKHLSLSGRAWLRKSFQCCLSTLQMQQCSLAPLTEEPELHHHKWKNRYFRVKHPLHIAQELV